MHDSDPGMAELKAVTEDMELLRSIYLNAAVLFLQESVCVSKAKGDIAKMTRDMAELAKIAVVAFGYRSKMFGAEFSGRPVTDTCNRIGSVGTYDNSTHTKVNSSIVRSLAVKSQAYRTAHK